VAVWFSLMSQEESSSPTPAPTRKRADGRETIAKVLKAAEAEMELHGNTKFNLDRVIATTGVARSSIYHHFGDRDGLIAAVETEYLLKRFDAGMDDLAAALDAAKSGEEAFALVEIGIAFSGSERQRAARWRRISTLASARSTESIRDSLRATQQKGTSNLAAMIDKLKDRGFCDPIAPSLGVAFLIQSILIGRILADIVEDRESDEVWNATATASLRALLRPTSN
jgi:AcrR family transcriptional regulator